MTSVFSIDAEGRATPIPSVRCRDEERELQQLLAQNPGLLPGDQIDPENPRRWLLIRCELPVPGPAHGSDQWSIDLVFADQDAVPTLVECKRFADTRSRREVVGQMLDYAANGSYYWNQEEIAGFASTTAETSGHDLETAIASLDPNVGSTADEFFAEFVSNLREGELRLVFFMEEAPDELKSIAEFLNRQMDRVEVLVVEARHFDVENTRIVIPSLFGYTEEARRTEQSASPHRARRAWTKDDFIDDARDRLGDNELRALETLLGFFKEQQFPIRWGTGKSKGLFNVVLPAISRRSLMHVNAAGKIYCNFSQFDEDDRQRGFRDELAERLREDFSAPFPAEVGTVNPPLDAQLWVSRVSELQEMLVELTEKHQKPG